MRWLLLLLPFTASAAHMDLDPAHPQAPLNYDAAGIRAPMIEAQGHWCHPPLTCDSSINRPHIHTAILNPPNYAEVSNPFTIDVQVLMHKFPAAARGITISAEWQQGGNKISNAGTPTTISISDLQGNPAGATVPFVTTMTIDPAKAKKSGKILLRIGAKFAFNSPPLFNNVAAIRVPLNVINSNPLHPSSGSNWNVTASTIANHKFADGSAGGQHEFQYSFLDIAPGSWLPILPINVPWTVSFITQRAERAFEHCGVTDFRSWITLDPALHAGSDGTTLYGPVTVSGRYDYPSVVLDPGAMATGDHKLMARGLTDGGAPSVCPPPVAGLQDEPILQQEALLVVGFTVGQSVPAECANLIDDDGDGLIDYPADPGCNSAADNDETDPLPTLPAIIFVPGSEAGQSSGTWDTTNDSGDVTYNRQ